ncbi:MAG: hypothetical protein ACYCVZ_10430 [Streptosporangiaceae bacterium]
MTPAEAIGLIEAAAGPDDLFGADPGRTYRLLARLTHPDAGNRDPRSRPDDARRLLAELDEVLARLFGPRRFRPFTMPAHGS